ncbi:MAG: protein translocase subunit SecF [Candidatus Magasanikbacteria bacterium]
MLDIIKYRKFTFILSGIFVGVSLVLLIIFGLNLGIDFTGGSMMQLKFDERPSVDQIEKVLKPMNLGSLVVKPADEKSMILKMEFIKEDTHQEILTKIRNEFETENNKVIEEKVNTIGPAISSELKENSIYAAIGVILAIIGYIAYAFRKVSKPVASWKYGLTAIFALVHDVMITMGVFAVLGYIMQVEVNIPFAVAMLTILGYSVNDTIVVFDRIREKLNKLGVAKFKKSIIEGVNDTLVRSVNTSLTTLGVLFALLLFGGDSIFYFSLALIIGIGLGTYSSIFLASPILYTWKKVDAF